MSAITLKSARGLEGEVRVPSLGLVIGTFQKWTLTRSADIHSTRSVYVLQAAFSYINPLLWNEESLTKEIVVKIGKQRYRVEPGQKTVLQDSALVMEGVTLTPWPVQ